MKLSLAGLASFAARSTSLALLSWAPSAAATPVDEGTVAPDYERFADEVETTIARLDGRALGRSLDLEALVTRAAQGVELPPRALVDFRRGLAQGLDFGQMIVDAVSSGGSYTLLRLHEEEGLTFALFRLISEGGVNYHDLTLAHRRDGSVCVIDAYYYAMGEALSDTLRRTLLKVSAAENASFLERLAGRERDYLRHLGRIDEIQADAAAGRFEHALAIYDELPRSVQLEKPFLLSRVMIAQNLGEAVYAQAMADYEQQFPDDPSLDLMLIDLHVLREDYDRALATVDRLERRVVRDPYLDSVRGHLQLGAGRVDRARRSFRRCIDDEPTLDAGYFGLVDVAIATEDFDAVPRHLAKLEELFGYDFDGIETEPYFAAFVGSPAYQRWRHRAQ